MSPMIIGATPSRPTRAGESERAAKAAAKLTPTRIATPTTCPATTPPRGRLRSEKNPTKTNKSSTLVEAKTPADSSESETTFKRSPEIGLKFDLNDRAAI